MSEFRESGGDGACGNLNNFYSEILKKNEINKETGLDLQFVILNRLASVGLLYTVYPGIVWNL